MSEQQIRYKQMERLIGCVLGAAVLLFIIYLIAAGCGVVWLKAVTSILVILAGAGCIGYLYMTQELLKRRSLWMGMAAAALVLCTLLSLIFCFPSPNPLKAPEILELIQ